VRRWSFEFCCFLIFQFDALMTLNLYAVLLLLDRDVAKEPHKNRLISADPRSVPQLKSERQRTSTN
jgi:hypothetical protein